MSGRPFPDGKLDWAECECEHEREEHAPDGGECQHVMSSGLPCSCPSFEEAK